MISQKVLITNAEFLLPHLNTHYKLTMEDVRSKCPICLSTITQPALLSNCLHVFGMNFSINLYSLFFLAS